MKTQAVLVLTVLVLMPCPSHSWTPFVPQQQVEKVSHSVATRLLKSLGTIESVGASLGSFSMSNLLVDVRKILQMQTATRTRTRIYLSIYLSARSCRLLRAVSFFTRFVSCCLRFVSFRFVSARFFGVFVSFRVVPFRFGSCRFALFGVLFCFVMFVLCRFVSFRFVFVCFGSVNLILFRFVSIRFESCHLFFV